MTTSCRRLLLPCAVLLLALGLGACGDSLEIRRPSNVVLIVLDTLRADHLGAYGSTRGLTPNLDRLAERSIVFENAIATSSWTRPSIASMLTSKYPTSLGLFSRKDALAEAHQTLAESLRQEAGLVTLGVSTSPNSGAEFGFGKGYDHYVTSTLSSEYPGDRPIPIAEGVNAEGLRLLDEHAPAGGFFLFLHYLDPHAPYLPHPELMDAPEPAGRFDGSRRRVDAMDKRLQELTESDRQRIRYLYAGEVRYLDQWLGRLFDELDGRGLGEETMIVITSDHGEGLWDHGLRDHGNDLYRETVHVPLIVHYPGMDESDGRRVTAPVSLIDIASTVFGVFVIEPPAGYQGADLVTHLDAEEVSAEELVLSEMDLRGRRLRSIRRGNLKLIETGEQPCERDTTIELFDLASDPDEQQNLVGQRRDVEARLATLLAKSGLRLVEGGDAREEVELSDLDPATLDSLRALGYLSAGEHRKAIEARNATSTGRAAPQRSRSAPARQSAIDFSHRRPATDQLLYGFKSKGRDGRHACRNSAVVLARKPFHAGWHVLGETRPALAPGETISLSIFIDGEEVGSLTTQRNGPFRLEGQLFRDAEPAGDTTELTIACDRSGAPPETLEDRSPFCATIHRIELR